MITTTLCDSGQHHECKGEGLANGILRPAHEPEAEGRNVFITVKCGCECHRRKAVNDLLIRAISLVGYIGTTGTERGEVIQRAEQWLADVVNQTER